MRRTDDNAVEATVSLSEDEAEIAGKKARSRSDYFPFSTSLMPPTAF